MKYRIFNKETGKYCDPYEWIVNQDGEVCFVFWQNNSESIARSGNQDNFIVERSSGLVAPDGAEIYEGDVSREYRRDGDYYITLDVRFKYGSFWFNETYLFDKVYDRAIEKIIGNINENPELLKS